MKKYDHLMQRAEPRVKVVPVQMNLSGEAGRRVLMAAVQRVMKTHADVINALAFR